MLWYAMWQVQWCMATEWQGYMKQNEDGGDKSSWWMMLYA